MYLHFMSFLYIDLIQVVKTLPHVRQELTYSTMDADILAVQGTRASATMIFLVLNQNNLVPAH